jgi:hypothetical protein
VACMSTAWPTRGRSSDWMRFAGPWQLDREQVTSVASTGKGSILVFGVEILSTQGGQRWVFNAMSPPRGQVVRALADLGYPARA